MRRILKDYPKVSLRTEDLHGQIDFAKLIGRPRAVHIEIGAGKGTFLLNQAKALPDDNFLGIEWARKYYRYAVDRIGRWDLKNVRIIRADAVVFLADFVPDNSVDFFHIYFYMHRFFYYPSFSFFFLTQFNFSVGFCFKKISFFNYISQVP